MVAEDYYFNLGFKKLNIYPEHLKLFGVENVMFKIINMISKFFSSICEKIE